MINRLKRTALILALIFLLLCGSAVALMFHRTETIRNDLELPEQCPIIPFSAEKGNGREELLRQILAVCE